VSAHYAILLLKLKRCESPVGLWKFGQFMASEMNAETLVFWLNVGEFKPNQ
jgi:hypothetical protein